MKCVSVVTRGEAFVEKCSCSIILVPLFLLHFLLFSLFSLFRAPNRFFTRGTEEESQRKKRMRRAGKISFRGATNLPDVLCRCSWAIWLYPPLTHPVLHVNVRRDLKGKRVCFFSKNPNCTLPPFLLFSLLLIPLRLLPIR